MLNDAALLSNKSQLQLLPVAFLPVIDFHGTLSSPFEATTVLADKGNWLH